MGGSIRADGIPYRVCMQEVGAGTTTLYTMPYENTVLVLTTVILSFDEAGGSATARVAIDGDLGGFGQIVAGDASADAYGSFPWTGEAIMLNGDKLQATCSGGNWSITATGFWVPTAMQAVDA